MRKNVCLNIYIYMIFVYEMKGGSVEQIEYIFSLHLIRYFESDHYLTKMRSECKSKNSVKNVIEAMEESVR